MNTPTKHCTKCGQEFPATPEYFYRDSNGKDGLSWRCKICLDTYRRAHSGYTDKIKKRKPKPQSADGYKYCSRCERHFPANTDYFGPRKRAKDGLNLWCTECNRRYSREHRSKNPSMYRESGKRYDKTPNGKLSKQIAVRKRRATRKNLPNDFTASDWQRALDYFNGCCAVCGRSPGLWHVIAADHWIPLSNPNSPGTVPSNIIPLCDSQKGGEGTCNESKSNKAPDRWLTERFGEHKAKRILKRIQDYFNSLSQ